MTPQQQEEFKANFNLIILAYKLKAIKESLSSEQLLIYNKSIELSKKELKETLEKSLSSEQVDELLLVFDN